jgi:hypothetical protein
MDDKEYVQEFIQKMNTQNNRCTATPFYYVIMDVGYEASYHEGEGDRVSIVVDTESYHGETIKEAVEELVNCEVIDGLPKEIDIEDPSDVQSYMEDKVQYFNGIFWEKEKDVERGVFFTETDAENHLRANKHHYSSRAKTYVKHAWRAPELEQFFKSVARLVDMEFERK